MTIVTRKSTVWLIILVFLGGLLLYLGFAQGKALAPPPPSPEKAPAEFTPHVQEEENPREVTEDFFATYCLEREQARAQQIEILKSIINNPQATPQAKEEAQKKLLAATQQAEQEMQIEHLIAAKGYPEAVAFIQPEAVTVVVKGKNLGEIALAQIADLVVRTTKQDPSEVIIIPRE